MRQLVATIIFCTALSPAFLHGDETNLAMQEEQAMREAAAVVADSVVQIRTVGGLDRVGKTLLSHGPTTGLIVSADGYIVSSAFNFAGQPTSILVRLADGEQMAAELIARDKNRMLVLLKIAANRPLPVPEAVARKNMRVGQWAIALGRTFQAEQVGVSVGIVSALDRMYGRVIQTDASISVANYGGPLVDIEGRVLGVLVPMSPQGGKRGAPDELAGAEFYDSGIGFAVPLEHIFSILKRLKHGEDLLPGKLGIGLKKGNAHTDLPEISSVWPNSPATQAGWKLGDIITSVNGTPVATQAELRFQLIPRYAGERISVAIHRGDAELQTSATLTGKLSPFRHAFLGILPRLNPGEEEPDGAKVRDVWPSSPAAAAGINPGDVVTKVGKNTVQSTSQAREALVGLHPKEVVKILLKRGNQEQAVSATLTTLPEEILPKIALSTNARAENDPNEVGAKETKLEKLKLPGYEQEALYYSPTMVAEQSLGLVMWLGDGVAENNQQLVDRWQPICRRAGLVLLIASPAAKATWRSDDLPYLEQLAQTAIQRLKIENRPKVVVGEGKAGQLAYALAMNRRSSFSGVVSIDAPMPRTLKLPPTSPSKVLAVLAIEARGSNFSPLIRNDIKRLRDTGYPTSRHEYSPTNDDRQGLDTTTHALLGRWIEGLDRY